jgi:4-amino-4-deoxychorismate lyase
MCLLVETIKSEDGRLINLEFHSERMRRTLYDLFRIQRKIDLAGLISVPSRAGKGVFKCRLEYNKSEIGKPEFIPYTQKPVKSLKIVEANTISYDYKFADRKSIISLLGKKDKCDDILIIKNGFITDSSYANVIFRDFSGVWHTPSTFLLPGTRRASLLHRGRIRETVINIRDLEKYVDVKLINAMLDIDDTEGIPVNNMF